jgi:hypothetical protein
VELTVIALLGGLALSMPAPAGGDGCAPLADSTCHCPPGTEFAIDPNGDREAGYTDQVQSVRIEYCRKRDAKGNWVRHGPCIVRGPNDERYEVGEYIDGQRDGVWRHWGPSQTNERRYDHGRYDREFVGKIDYPDSVTIDFCNCRVQAGLTYQSMGSSWWRLRGVKGDTCIVALGHEIEGGYPPTSIYHVPRTFGRITLPKATQYWSVLAPYFVRNEGKGGNLLFER